MTVVDGALSFYIHIPYCLSRCGYCDFNTYTPAELGQSDLGRSEISSRYIAAAREEVRLARKTLLGDREVSTIFLGGGTPSLMEPRDIKVILSAIAEDFSLATKCEITMEANPDTVDEENLTGFIDAGVNRFSFGLQSANTEVLKVLERTHRSENVTLALETAKRLGIDDLSVDLIYGTPGEKVADLQESLDFALSLPINHISAYALIVEEGTRLARKIEQGEIEPTDDDEMAMKYQLIEERLNSAGFAWYELSNWAKPGGESIHNQVYWRNGDWWGIGPGAHSHIDGRRWWNIKSPIRYIDAIARGESIEASSEILSDANKRDEKIMLMIRMRDGLRREDLTQGERTIVEEYVKAGAIDEKEWLSSRLVLTVAGRLIADRIVRDLVSVEALDS